MKTVVLDIETIANAEAMERARYQPSEEEFVPWPLHEIACASIMTVERAGHDGLAFSIESYTRADTGERGIVASVEQAVEAAQEVITFNGGGFDIPVLIARAVAFDVHVPTLVRLGSRARPGLHADLLREVTGFGSAPGVKLAHLCAPLGIPCKADGDGAGVANLAAIGDFPSIARYCETDVVATWLLAQMWRSSECPGFGRERWQAMSGWIMSDQPRFGHLLPYAHAPTLE